MQFVADVLTWLNREFNANNFDVVTLALELLAFLNNKAQYADLLSTIKTDVLVKLQ